MKSDEPGWYYVGNGQLRLWDGQRWTESFRSADRPRSQGVMQAVRPVGPAPDPYLGSEVPDRRGSRIVTWALVLATAVIAAVVGVTILRGNA